jgi:hypothetical protein
MAFQKNNAQASKLAALSKVLGVPVRQPTLPDEHLDRFYPVFYKGLPKLGI